MCSKSSIGGIGWGGCGGFGCFLLLVLAFCFEKFVSRLMFLLLSSLPQEGLVVDGLCGRLDAAREEC